MNNNFGILLIDDSALFIHRIKQLLIERYDRISIAIAGCFEEGLTMFARKTPDLIFLDINLPDRSGIDLLVAIRKMNRHVKIVMLTNNDPGEYFETCKRLGADYYVDKSLGFDSITAIIDKALESLVKQK
ncbi:response regulator [Niastella caeni]|uniref:Response regulator n=1 Tax=Niastella caeni TaxID=2569763 RepID=A0A4S8HVU8_9BACT|nr:response regulator transcription factor [Niastella caeni]THU38174.1 response regulator [Niastella caeni]